MSHRTKTHTHKLARAFKNYWRGGWWHKLVVAVTITVLLATSAMYGIAQWYIHSNANKPVQMGVSFIPAYAESLGLDPQETMDQLLAINVRHFRLVSYWNQIEPTKDSYDFSQLDWQFQKAEAEGAKITLTLGLRQPRWPECHAPDWTSQLPDDQEEAELLEFMAAVVKRYRNSPSLQDYQVENEYFLKGFGICTNHSRERLVKEYNLVKELDPRHPIIVNRSNNAIGFPVGQPEPDEYGISIYKRVWEGTLSHRYAEYPFPAWFYGFLAGTQKIYSGRDMRISELQAEAWPPKGQNIPETSLEEQNKSFNAARFEDRLEYGKATGMKEIYLWGSEYWYYRLVKLNDPSLWQVAQKEFGNKQ